MQIIMQHGQGNDYCFERGVAPYCVCITHNSKGAIRQYTTLYYRKFKIAKQ